jgi:hypothetical protein
MLTHVEYNVVLLGREKTMRLSSAQRRIIEALRSGESLDSLQPEVSQYAINTLLKHGLIAIKKQQVVSYKVDKRRELIPGSEFHVTLCQLDAKHLLA